MSAILLAILIVIDVLLLGVIYYLGKQRINPIEIVKELTEERKVLGELRRAVKEEIGFQDAKGKQIVDKVSTLATEIEMELKAGGATMAQEVDRILANVAARIDEPLQALARKQAALEMLLKRVERERQILVKAVGRGEKIAKFFDKRLPYEDVLEEIEDKKYVDARQLLSQGVPPKQVATELGLPESEVNLLVGLGR